MKVFSQGDNSYFYSAKTLLKYAMNVVQTVSV